MKHTVHLAFTLAAAGLLPAARAQFWETVNPLPEPREFATGLNFDGFMLALGGRPYVVNNDTPVHSLAPGAFSWVVRQPMEGPIVRRGAGIDTLGRIIVFGGVDGIDPEGDTGKSFWYSLNQGQRAQTGQRSGLAPDDNFAFATDQYQRIYSIGGGPGRTATPQRPNSARVERYDGARDVWDVLVPMPNAVANAAAAYDGLGHILVFGGYNAAATARTANVARYDIASNTWSDTAVPDMPVATSGLQAALGADGQVYVFGGQVGPVGGGSLTGATHVLDPAAGVWTSGPTMSTPRHTFATAVNDLGYIYAIGGTAPGGATASVERLDTPRTRTVLFDFDQGPVHRSLPLDFYAEGVQAHLTATDQGFSSQWANAMGFTPVGFGGICIYPNSVFRADLIAEFSHTITDFSILYCPQELGCDDSARMRATGSMNGVFVATNTTTAHDPGTYPTATLRLHADAGFNKVVVHYDAGPPTCRNWGPIFLADNMKVTLAPEACYADCDQSTGQGVLDIFDFLCFQNRYSVNDPYACDCDTSTGPGVCDIFDFLCFQNAFAAGCG